MAVVDPGDRLAGFQGRRFRRPSPGSVVGRIIVAQRSRFGWLADHDWIRWLRPAHCGAVRCGGVHADLWRMMPDMTDFRGLLARHTLD